MTEAETEAAMSNRERLEVVRSAFVMMQAGISFGPSEATDQMIRFIDAVLEDMPA